MDSQTNCEAFKKASERLENSPLALLRKWENKKQQESLNETKSEVMYSGSY